jgi:hypothetical protein
VRGTSDDKLISGDVVRKLLPQMKRQAALSQPPPRLPQEPSVTVKVRERASRRAVKKAVEDTVAEARAYQVAAQLVGWYNQQVGDDIAVGPPGPGEADTQPRHDLRGGALRDGDV